MSIPRHNFIANNPIGANIGIQEMFSEQLISRMKSAERVAVLTGAGVSAESGVPTFRGDDGIWKKFKSEELASFDAFMRNPDLVWEWYKHRKEIHRTVQPNPGHFALAAMEDRYKEFSITTQNIDNLHRRAGSKNIYELHGNIERNYCIACGTNYRDEDMPLHEMPPRCTKCKGLVRPDVVWFGELLPVDAWESAAKAAKMADVYLSIGTSAIVYPAASLPSMAKHEGAYLVEINPEPTPLSVSADEFIPAKSGEALPELLRLITDKG